jgi:hypothetical protein
VEDYKEDLVDYFGHTVVHPAGLAIVVLLAISMLLVPRRWALLPMVLVACFVSQAQRIVIVGLNFDFPRILMLAGFLRLLVRGEFGRLRWSAIDTCLSLYAVSGVVTYCMLHADAEALQYRLGWAFDIVGSYFLFRFLLRTDADPKTVARPFVLASVPVAAFFAVEYLTHRNLFSVFGGVPATTWVRDGRLRCQGPFAHPVIAGVYWAAQMPLFGALCWFGPRWRTWGLVGGVAAMFIIATTNSSTSITALAFGGLAMLAYPLRHSMRGVRWATVGILCMLHLVMKAPVWHLLASATVFDASTGWDRFFVIDQSLRHFGDWWLMGVKGTESWDVVDITNEYAFTGIEGGVSTLILLLAVIWFAFRRVGSEIRRLAADPPACRMAWALGCALFVHCTNFIGLSYYGQAKFVWYLLLALIASQGPKIAESTPRVLLGPGLAESRRVFPSRVGSGTR